MPWPVPRDELNALKIDDEEEVAMSVSPSLLLFLGFLGWCDSFGQIQHLFRRNLLDDLAAGFIHEFVNHDVARLHFNQHVGRADSRLGLYFHMVLDYSGLRLRCWMLLGIPSNWLRRGRNRVGSINAHQDLLSTSLRRGLLRPAGR